MSFLQFHKFSFIYDFRKQVDLLLHKTVNSDQLEGATSDVYVTVKRLHRWAIRRIWSEIGDD